MLQDFKALISVGKTQEAIGQMAKLAAAKGNSMYNDLVLLSGQVAKNQSMFTLGLVKLEDFKLSESQTNFAILSILDSMESENLLDKDVDLQDHESDNKTKLLFLASNPSDLPLLQLEKEFIEIRKIFRNKKTTFETVEAFDVSLDLFFEEIYNEKPQIIHFTGYGTDDDLVFSRNIDRTQHYVSYEFLAASSKLLRSHAECVFINTQGSALFAKVISRFIPFAVGVKGMVMDDEAISFSSGFYAALAIEKDYEKAFKNGKELFLNQKEQNRKFESQKEEHKKNLKKKPTKKEDFIDSNYFLYKNGFSAEDTTSPDDFYVPESKPATE